MKTEDMIRGLVRAAEMIEQRDGTDVWDDEVRRSLEEARRLGWGKNKVGQMARLPRPPEDPLIVRHGEPGWILCAMNDPVGRRGIWMRPDTQPDLGPIAKLEICGGREGDDAYVCIERSQPLDGQALNELFDILDTGRWMLEEQTIRKE